jgi:hypothetical protein
MIIVGGAIGFSATSKFSLSFSPTIFHLEGQPLLNHSDELTVVFKDTEEIKGLAGSGSNFCCR